MFQGLRERAQARYKRWLNRRIPRVSSLRLNQRSIFIFPSRAGIGFLAVLLLLLIVAINYQNNLIFALVFWLLALFIVCILHTFVGLSGLTLTAGGAQPVFAGDSAAFKLSINGAGKPRYGLLLDWPGHNPIKLDIGPNTETVYVRYPANNRGVLEPPRMRLKSYYPLGLIRAWTWASLDWTCIVYPAPIHSNADIQGEGKDGEEGQVTVFGEDFSGFTAFKPGDPLRHAWWRGYAKGGDLQLKDFTDHRSPDNWLSWEDYPNMPVEQRLSALCARALEAEEAQFNYGLRLPSVEIEPALGAAHLAKILHQLAVYKA